MVSIIIVNYNGKDVTAQCLRSLQKNNFKDPFEIIVVDNASNDGSVEFIRQEFPNVVLLPQTKNGGFGRANNEGVKYSKGEYLFFLNNDTIVTEDLIEPLRKYLVDNPTVGAVAPMLIGSDRKYQYSYGYFPSLLNEWKTKRDTKRNADIPKDRSPKKVDWVSFAAVMIPRKAFIQVGGFDERYFMYFEDADLCYRLKKAGMDTVYYPQSSLVHFGSVSWSSPNTKKIRYEYRRSQMLFYKLYNSRSELTLLRIYLIFKYFVIAMKTRNEDRQNAKSIIQLALTYAHSS